MHAKVVKLYITKNDTNKTRISPDAIEIDKDGVIGDKFYAKESNRAILITSVDSYELSRKNGIELPDGALGENILIDASPYHLLPGDKIIINDIELEITQNCTLCKGLSTLSPKLPKLLKNDRGIFAKVCNNSAKGTIHLDDSVTMITTHS
jgi:MOSC domain-containing protein YiiM